MANTSLRSEKNKNENLVIYRLPINLFRKKKLKKFYNMPNRKPWTLPIFREDLIDKDLFFNLYVLTRGLLLILSI